MCETEEAGNTHIGWRGPKHVSEFIRLRRGKKKVILSKAQGLTAHARVFDTLPDIAEQAKECEHKILQAQSLSASVTDRSFDGDGRRVLILILPLARLCGQSQERRGSAASCGVETPVDFVRLWQAGGAVARDAGETIDSNGRQWCVCWRKVFW